MPEGEEQQEMTVEQPSISDEDKKRFATLIPKPQNRPREVWDKMKQRIFHSSEKDKRRDDEAFERNKDDVSVGKLTPQELELTNFPMEDLQHLEISLVSQADRKYRLWYNYHDSWEHSPKVGIHAPEGDKDPEDFTRAKGIIAQMNDGTIRPDKYTDKTINDKNADIGLPKTYTLAKIADLMGKYRDYFKEVGGAVLSFELERERSLKFANEMDLPREKISISSWDHQDNNVTENSKDPNKDEMFRFLEDSFLAGLAEVPVWAAAAGGAFALGAEPETVAVLAGAASWSLFMSAVTGAPVVASERAIRFAARTIKELRNKNQPPENGNNIPNTSTQQTA